MSWPPPLHCPQGYPPSQGAPTPPAGPPPKGPRSAVEVVGLLLALVGILGVCGAAGALGLGATLAARQNEGPSVAAVQPSPPPAPPAYTEPPKSGPPPKATATAPKVDKRIRCCDGTYSPSCTTDRADLRGCCSHHKGVCG